MNDSKKNKLGGDFGDVYSNSCENENLPSEDPVKKELDGIQFEKNTFTVYELLNSKIPKPQKLWDPFLQSIGTAAIVGQPDSGKSTFSRLLSLHIASGQDKFLGFPLNAKHRRVLYISTEDDIENTKDAFGKMIAGLGIKKDLTNNIHVIFGDALDSDFIDNHLNGLLQNLSIDLMVVDSFQAVFIGDDPNKNLQMRKTVGHYDRIAKKYKCLVLFVHHINKNAYKQNPDQVHVQGGSGFVQKVRAVMDLRSNEADPTIKYFSVVKGNYIPSVHKKDAIILNFVESNLLFSNTGETIPKDEIIVTNDKKVDIDWNKLFGFDDELQRKEIVDRIESLHSISHSTADKYLKEAFVKKILKKTGFGKYALNDGKESDE